MIDSDTRKKLACAALISAIKKNKNKFIRISDTVIFNPSDSEFVKKAREKGKECDIVFSLCVKEEYDMIKISSVVLDRPGNIILNKYDSYYNEIKGLIRSI